MAPKKVIVFDTNVNAVLDGVSKLAQSDAFLCDKLVFKRWCEGFNKCRDVQDADPDEVVNSVAESNPKMIFEFNTPLVMMETLSDSVKQYLNSDRVTSMFFYLDTHIAKSSTEWTQLERLLKNLEDLDSEKIVLVIKRPPFKSDATASDELRASSNEAYVMIMNHMHDRSYDVRYLLEALASMQVELVAHFVCKLIKTYVKFKKHLSRTGLLTCLKNNFALDVCREHLIQFHNAILELNLQDLVDKAILSPAEGNDEAFSMSDNNVKLYVK